MTMIRRVSSLALVAVVALLVGLPFLAFAQSSPSIPFAPMGSGGGGGGGCPGPACDAAYLRLDNANAAALTSAGSGLVYDAAEPVFGGVGIGLTSDSAASYLWAADLGGFAYVMASADSYFAGSGSVGFGDGGAGDLTLTAFLDPNAFFNINAGAAGGTLYASFAKTTGYSFLSHSTTAPSFNYLDDQNTGYGRTAADSTCTYTSGTCRLTTSTTATTSTLPFVLPLGALATPALTFTGDLNTGFYSPAADWVSVTTGGTSGMTWTGLSTVAGVRIEPGTLSIDLGQPAQYFDDVYGDAFTVHDDVVGTPGFTWINDLDTGFYRPGANAVSVAAGGADVFAFTTTNAQTLNVRPKTDNVSDLGSGSFKYANAYIGTVIADKVEADPGTAAAPTLTFGTDTTSGLYLASSSIPAMAAGGALTTAWGLNHRSTTLDGMSAVGFVAAPVFDYGNANVTAAPGAPATCSATIEGFTLYARDTDLSTNNGALCLCTCASVVANACDSWGWRLPDGSAGRVCDLL